MDHSDAQSSSKVYSLPLVYPSRLARCTRIRQPVTRSHPNVVIRLLVLAVKSTRHQYTLRSTMYPPTRPRSTLRPILHSRWPFFTSYCPILRTFQFPYTLPGFSPSSIYPPVIPIGLTQRCSTFYSQKQSEFSKTIPLLPHLVPSPTVCTDTTALPPFILADSTDLAS